MREAFMGFNREMDGRSLHNEMRNISVQADCQKWNSLEQIPLESGCMNWILLPNKLKQNSLLGLEIATKRDIIGIALANLIRLHWKRASRSNHGLMLTSPLRHVHNSDNSRLDEMSNANIPLLRPQELRLAIMASERLLTLQPHNWALRRDHGMMLYYSREYGKAVQELSICMAFAPEEEAQVLEPFVEKLHLMRLESSWKSLGHAGPLPVP